MFPSIRRATPVVAALAAAGLVLASCSTASPESEAPAGGETITISTNNGQVEVPKNPTRVVALDNTSFETLKAFGVTPAAVPKRLLAPSVLSEWITNPDIKDVGTHAEPKLDVIEDVNPDLIIGGFRFEPSADDLTKIADQSGGTLIDVAANPTSDGGAVAAMIRQTTALGEVFGKQDQAKRIIDDFNAKLGAATAQATGQTAFLSVVNGGKIDNGGERMDPFTAPVGIKDVFAGQGGDLHSNSGLTPEAIAQADPQWVIVMDRDSAVPPRDGSKPQTAEAVFQAQEAFRGKQFYDRDRIFYLDSAFYIREGIQCYGENYERLAEAIAAKK